MNTEYQYPLFAAEFTEISQRFRTQLIAYLNKIWVEFEDEEEVVSQFPMAGGQQSRLLSSLNITNLDKLSGYLLSLNDFTEAALEALNELEEKESDDENEEASDQLYKFKSSLSTLGVAVGMERNSRPGNLKSYVK